MRNYIIQLLEGIDNLLFALIIFIIINLMTDLLVAFAEKKRYFIWLFLMSIFRKTAILILVIVSSVIDLIVGKDSTIRTAVILFYLSNEGLAILKNVNHLGVPLPQILVKILNQLVSEQ